MICAHLLKTPVQRSATDQLPGKGWRLPCRAATGLSACGGSPVTASLLRWPRLGLQAELLPLWRSEDLRLSIHRLAKRAECQRLGQSSEGLRCPRGLTSTTPAVMRAVLEYWTRSSQTLALGASIQAEAALSLATEQASDGWANANLPHRCNTARQGHAQRQQRRWRSASQREDP